MSRTVSRSSSATSFVVLRAQIARVLSRIASRATTARRAWPAILRAVSQIVTSKAAATRMTTAATSIQIRQAAHRSALVIAVLPGRAPVYVVLAITWAVCSPEAVLPAGRPPRLLGPQVLPHAVEELDRPVGCRLRLDMGPAARHLPRHVPAVLPVGLAIGESAESADYHAHALGGKSRDNGAGWRLVERAELVREARHGAPDAHDAATHAPGDTPGHRSARRRCPPRRIRPACSPDARCRGRATPAGRARRRSA